MPTRNTDGSPRNGQPFSTLCAAAGTELARVRIARGISVGDVADRLLLSPRQVEALEDGDTNSFHSSSYYLSALRRYAAFAEIDSALVTSVGDAMRTMPTRTPASVMRASATAAAALLVIGVISASVWWFTRTPTSSVASGVDAVAPIPTIVFSQDPSTPSVPLTSAATAQSTVAVSTVSGTPVDASAPGADSKVADSGASDASAAASKAAEAEAANAKPREATIAGNEPGAQQSLAGAATPPASPATQARAASNGAPNARTASSASSVPSSPSAASVPAAADAAGGTKPAAPHGSDRAKPPAVSGAFGALRVHDATWVLVRDANDSVVGRTLPADGAFPLDSAPTYLAVGTPNVDLFVGSRRVDIADYVVNGQIEMRTRDFAAVAERDRAGQTSDRR